MGIDCLILMGFLGGDGSVWNWMEVLVAHCAVLNATKLFTLKRLYYRNFTVIQNEI